MTGNPTVHPSIAGCMHVLDSCVRAVECMPAEVYTDKDETHESIGAHLRHGIEHIQCFIAGLPKGVINYDLRERDETIETNPEAFIAICTELIANLRALKIEDFDAPLIVRQLPAPECKAIDVQSSAARELIFLSSHIIHHISVVQAYCRQHSIELPEGINIAFSTAAYRKKLVAG